ncbi:MAG: metal-sensitive transcriptional regulator [Planctomycetota bacterium]
MATHPDHSDNSVALRRIEGQVRGVQRMVEEKKYCVDILTQISAIKGALARVEENILRKHLQHTLFRQKGSLYENIYTHYAVDLVRCFCLCRQSGYDG